MVGLAVHPGRKVLDGGVAEGGVGETPDHPYVVAVHPVQHRRRLCRQLPRRAARTEEVWLLARKQGRVVVVVDAEERRPYRVLVPYLHVERRNPGPPYRLRDRFGVFEPAAD